MSELIITSRSNESFRLLKKLASSAKFRRQHGSTIAAGVHLVEALLETHHAIELAIFAQSAKDNPEVAALVDRLAERQVKTVIFEDQLYEAASNVHAPIGVSAIFAPPQPPTVMRLTANCVLLDDVQDPGNVGTILRIAAAVGMSQVFLSSGCASAWSPRALRAGMGGQLGLDIYESADLELLAGQSDIPILVTSLAADSRSLYDLDLNQPVAWLFGSEGQGVRPSLAALANSSVTIPQAVSSVESLNVAAAVAVCLYEQYRQTSVVKPGV